MNTLLAATFFLALAADDPARSRIHPQVVPIGSASRAGQDDPHVEMKRIFGRVETQLREIDRLLSDASAGGAGTRAASDAVGKAVKGISDLIKGSQENGHSVVAGIDRILELANHPHPPGPG